LGAFRLAEHYIMVHAARENEIYRRDAKANHSLLTPAEREKLLQVCSRLTGTWTLLTIGDSHTYQHRHQGRPTDGRNQHKNLGQGQILDQN
jgi:hypothetical protein